MFINKLSLWIPSRDRACQADLLLRSIVHNWKNLPSCKITYECSNEDFNKGYEKLKELWPDITFEYGSDLYQDFLHNLSTCESEYICCCTDDTVFYREVDLTDEELDYVFDDDALTISLRQGRNCLIQDYMSKSKQEVPNYEQKGKFLSWFYKNHSDVQNVGYPFQIDGSIFRAKTLNYYSRLLAGHCKTLRGWEGTCNGHQHRSHIKENTMVCFENSVCVNIPNNCTQSEKLYISHQTKASPEYLNQKFLEGEEIDLQEIMNTKIEGGHQGIPYILCSKS